MQCCVDKKEHENTAFYVVLIRKHTALDMQYWPIKKCVDKKAHCIRDVVLTHKKSVDKKVHCIRDAMFTHKKKKTLFSYCIDKKKTLHFSCSIDKI